jgi:alpha-tubulin suppressor-like RCC1 family protein
VVASGTAPLTYQWRRNGQLVTGATQPTFALTTTALAESGDRYSVVVTNGVGQAVSSDAVLTVNLRPKLALCSAAYVVRVDGTLWSWGSNELLALGRGTNDPALQPTPQPVPSVSNAINIACGSEHTFVLLRSGSVLSWGRNTNGQLGDGSRTSRNAPAPIPGLADVVAIAAGRYSGYAVKRDGSLWRWGSLAAPVLPSPQDANALLVPQEVPVPEPIAGIAVGYQFADTVLLVGRSGQLYYLGLDLRDALSGTLSTATVAIAGLSGVRQATVGGGFALAVKSDGSAVMWGSGSSGAQGNGTSGSFGGHFSQPVAVQGVTGINTVHAGSSIVVARGSNGRMQSWGSNSYGVLGRLGAGPDTQPGDIDLPDVESMTVSLTTPSALAMTRDGRVWAWGQNFYGVLGVQPSVAGATDFPQVVNGVTGR